MFEGKFLLIARPPCVVLLVRAVLHAIESADSVLKICNVASAAVLLPICAASRALVFVPLWEIRQSSKSLSLRPREDLLLYAAPPVIILSQELQYAEGAKRVMLLFLDTSPAVLPTRPSSYDGKSVPLLVCKPSMRENDQAVGRAAPLLLNDEVHKGSFR